MVRPAGHQYGALVMQWVVKLVLQAATSFRGASAVLEVFQPWLLGLERIPAPNTGQRWLLRLGLYELQRPKDVAADWVWMMDHTIQIGSTKCLLIVAVRLSAWEAAGRGALAHDDLTVLALEPMQRSSGSDVCQQMQSALQQTGEPRAVLTDGGSDLKRGIAEFQQAHPQVAALSDIKHKMALFLQSELDRDPQWSPFVTQVGQTKARLQQTVAACLIPPGLKTKARYMNLAELVDWGQRTLGYLDRPPAARDPGLPEVKVEAGVGWLRAYRESLGHWQASMDVVEITLAVVRENGYHTEAASFLQQRLAAGVLEGPSQRMAEQAVAFVAAQSTAARPGEHLPGSTECLESLIGKGKRLEGQQSRSGFTKMVLGMAAAVIQPTTEFIREALATVKTCDVHQWCEQKLGESLQSQRRRTLKPLSAGTKTG